MNAVIIEDEKKATKELSSILLSLRPDIRIVATLESVEDSIEWFTTHDSPDIIFSDIQLADGLSFQIFKTVAINAPVVFCTAFDEYMLDAFEANGINYILKPFSKEKIQQGLLRYDALKKTFSKEADQASQVQRLIDKLREQHKPTLLVHVKDKIIPVRTDDVAFLYYNNGVVHIGLRNQQTYFINQTLEEIESSLHAAIFFRANRQFIVNRNCVVDIERYFNRKLIVRLAVKTPEDIVVSKVRSTAFLQWLEQT
jgi:DNA-binding LytR/AlgR family response regulator